MKSRCKFCLFYDKLNFRNIVDKNDIGIFASEAPVIAVRIPKYVFVPVAFPDDDTDARNVAISAPVVPATEEPEIDVCCVNESSAFRKVHLESLVFAARVRMARVNVLNTKNVAKIAANAANEVRRIYKVPLV